MLITLTGENRFYLQSELSKLIRDAEDNHGSEAIERIDAEYISREDLINKLSATSLFSSYRLIILKNAGANKPIWESLVDIAEKLDAQTDLVIFEPTADKRTSSYKYLAKNSDFREGKILAPAELMAWVVDQAAKIGGVISPGDARKLIEVVGPDQLRLSLEIDKLVAYNKNISAQAIDALVTPTLEVSAFRLLDHVFAGRRAEVISMINDMQIREDPYKFIGLLASQCYTVAVILSAGRDKKDSVIVKDSGIHPFVLSKLRQLVNRIGAEKAKSMVASISDLDFRLKTTGVQPWDAILVTLLEIATY